MKKLIAFLLCMLLPFAALAEETDLTALWEQLSAYKAELETTAAGFEADIAAINSDLVIIQEELTKAQAEVDRLVAEEQDPAQMAWYVDYIGEVLKAANTVLTETQTKQAALAEKLAAVEELLAQPASAELAEQVKAMLPPPSLKGKHYIQIDIADYGTITAELDADVAPITVTNFVNLVNQGFYNGLTFHRIIDGFMIQGGCPLGNGTGNAGENIKGEFAQNGWENPIKHERGVLSMARSSAPDSASCQFFIMHQVSPWLDGQYAAFGHVLSGMEVVDAICANTPVADSNGTVEKDYQPVITSIQVIEKPAE